MKRKIAMLTALILVAVVAINAQSEKQKPPPPPKVDIVKFQPPVSVGIASQKEFLKKNPDVSDINWQETKTIILKLKSGKEEKYNLTNEAEKKSFTDKYGKTPIQPPPPPKKLT